jgi:hypothetical protein
MWAAAMFAAIALAGVVFMVWFLLGLIRDRAPSNTYWLVPLLLNPGEERLRKGNFGGETERKRREDYVELSENEGYARERASSTIALDIRPASGGLGWGSIQPKRVAFRQHDF